MDAIDVTKLLGGGGIGILLIVAMFYFLRHLERRDDHEARRSEAFLEVTRAAVSTMAALDSKSGLVIGAVRDLGTQVQGLDERLARIEASQERAG